MGKDLESCPGCKCCRRCSQELKIRLACRPGLAAGADRIYLSISLSLSAQIARPAGRSRDGRVVAFAFDAWSLSPMEA
jgi:hypothetical protein